MKKPSVKTLIPAISLIVIVIALAIVTVCALSQKSRVDGQYTELALASQLPDGTPVLRTAVPATPSPAPTIEPIPADDATDADPAGVESPYWSDGVLFVNDTYRSPDLSVTVTTTEDSEVFNKSLVYYVADVRVSDVTQIKTGCKSGDFERAGRGEFDRICENVNAFVAISGDYCPGLIIRNGEVYHGIINEKHDICVLLRNGEMVTMSGTGTTVKKIMEMDPWQAWQFGPALFDSKGNPISSYPGIGIAVRNPRSCIGYIEPGHYCLVVVDGRQKESRGVTLSELALLMQKLGCTQAYNLDGGASAHFYYNETVLNHPSGGGRVVADIVYVSYESYPESKFYCGKAGLSK